MSNESSPVGGAHGFDSEALEEWVAETATQKGVSKQQLLDEILSSYWVLEELSGVVTDSEVQGGASEGQPPVDGRGEKGADARGQSESSPSSSAEFSELKSELQGLRTAIEELSRDQDGEREDAESTEEGFSALEGQLEDLSSAVVERQTETDETVADLADRIEELAERVGEIDDRVGGVDDRADDLTDRLTAIESQLDEGMSLAELEAAVGETASAQTELEARLESEFDSIEQVLQHLLDTTDNIEYRLGAVSESRQEALRPIREHHAEQEALAELKSEAIRHDVKRGVCDNCEQKIDLGLLERPACPGCDRRFTGIKKSGWFPLSNAELQTTDRPREELSDRQRSPADDEPTTESTADERDGFRLGW